MELKRRHLLGAGAGVLAAGAARSAARFEPAPGLLAAASKEGRCIFYSAQIEELEMETIAAFARRFPSVKVEMVHAPGGQLITRIRSELVAGKLVADVIDHSDPTLLLPIVDSFIDYAPPNAADFLPGSSVSPKLWPRLTVGWCLAWNSALLSAPLKSWWDLTKPEFMGQGATPTAFAGGSTWTRIMFERKVLGEDYWAKHAAVKPRVYPTVAATADALVRGEAVVAPLAYAIVVPKRRDGAPLDYAFAPEGVPSFTFGCGIMKSAQHPAAARLYLDWCLSDEGQAFLMTLGHLTALKNPSSTPAGFDPSQQKLWFAEREEANRLRAPWLEDWSKVYGVRQ